MSTSQTHTFAHATSHTYAYAELAERYETLTDPSTPLPTIKGSGELAEYLSERRGYGHDTPDSFRGCSTVQAALWLREGYELPSLPAESLPTGREGIKGYWQWSEEDGEFEYDAYLAGEAAFYRQRVHSPNRPGINVRIRYGFLATTPHKVIADYGAWIGSAIRALQARGYDLAVTMFSESNNTAPGGVAEVNIVLAEFGQQKFNRDWSAMFSPAGFRDYYFLARLLPQIDEGIRRAVGGSCQPTQDFYVGWDEDTRTLLIETPNSPQRFDADAMTKQLERVDLP